MEPVSSPRNPRVVAASRLRRARERRERGCTLLEGPHLFAEALTGGAHIVEVFVLAGDASILRMCRDAGIDPTVVEQAVLDRLAPTESPRGPIAVMLIPPAERLTRDRLILEVADPGNAGTLIRSAAAFGLDVGVAAGAADAWSPKTLRAAAGAHFRTRVAQPPPVEPGIGSIASVVAGGVAPDSFADVLDPARRWAVLVGSEAHGIEESTAVRADVKVTIPMPGGSESLNAAVAGSLVAYELSRWRASTGPGAAG
jgi:RNA methyltransferase, TrmH family